MKKENDKTSEDLTPYSKPPVIKEVKDEILYRKVLKPTKVPHAWEINKFS
jgi:hypothetical protein